MTSPRKLAASVVLAAGLVVGVAGPASAHGVVDTNPNPGGGTVGLECTYQGGYQSCLPRYAPTRHVAQRVVFRNPFTALWRDVARLF